MSTVSLIDRKAARGRRAQRDGIDGEGRVAQALAASGWTIHGRRMRTAAGEIDIAAERDGLLALIEVKTRRDLDTAAYALGSRQRRRLCQAAAILQGACATFPMPSGTNAESPTARFGLALFPRGPISPWLTPRTPGLPQE